MKNKKITTEDFIKKAQAVHGDTYNYSKVIYTGIKNKISIICYKHGIFEQMPIYHLMGRGCSKCVKLEPLNTEEFINRAIKKHGNKYDYSKTLYINTRTKVTIICLEHGEFTQSPYSHFRGHGCKECYKNKDHHYSGMTTKEFIERSIKIFNDKYDYSKTEYINYHTELILTCIKHKKDFKVTPLIHIRSLSGCCPDCYKEIMNFKLGMHDFINRAKKIHRNRYDYNLVDYINEYKKIKIKCNNCGLIFEQIPKNHLKYQGCKRCYKSSGEVRITNWLNDNNIKFIHNYRFNNCRSINNNWLSFDFYLSEFNTCIEYDGIYHKKSIGKEDPQKIIDRKRNDLCKNIYCENNKIKLIRIDCDEFKNIEPILSKEILMKKVA